LIPQKKIPITVGTNRVFLLLCVTIVFVHPVYPHIKQSFSSHFNTQKCKKSIQNQHLKPGIQIPQKPLILIAFSKPNKNRQNTQFSAYKTPNQTFNKLQFNTKLWDQILVPVNREIRTLNTILNSVNFALKKAGHCPTSERV
jgi:hypothetical protein